MTNKIYLSLEAFYDDNPARRASPEADYGVWWLGPDGFYPRWRVSYIRDTGEVYAFAQGKGAVELLGVVKADAGSSPMRGYTG